MLNRLEKVIVVKHADKFYVSSFSWAEIVLDPLAFPGKGTAEQGSQWPSAVNKALTFKCYPVLFPLPPSHQLQLPFLLQSDKGFEEEPSGFPDHPLFLLKEQVQLLQGAQWLAAGLRGFCRRVYVLRVGPAYFQLAHEIFINVLSEGVAANGMSRFASLGQELSRAPGPQWGRCLEGSLDVCVQSIWAAVKVLAALLGPRLLGATQKTTHQRLRISKAPLPQYRVHVVLLAAGTTATKQDSFNESASLIIKSLNQKELEK